MKKLSYLLFIFLFYNCSNHEKVGDFKYKTGIYRTNSGKFEALVFKFKLYISIQLLDTTNN
jgi:hypothetical protein